jgi:hypothetical protein
MVPSVYCTRIITKFIHLHDSRCTVTWNKYSKLLLVHLHSTLVDVPMANGFPPAATWALSAASASACCIQNEGKELVDISPRKCIYLNDTQNIYNIKKERKSYMWPKTFGVVTEFGSVTRKIAVFRWGECTVHKVHFTYNLCYKSFLSQ